MRLLVPEMMRKAHRKLRNDDFSTFEPSLFSKKSGHHDFSYIICDEQARFLCAQLISSRTCVGLQ